MTRQILQTDRWVEMDLFYFDPEKLDRSIREVLGRLEPLYRNVEGYRGLIISCGWISDIVTECNGSPEQKLPFLSASSGGWKHRNYSDLRRLVEIVKATAVELGIPGFKVGIMMVGWGHFDWGKEHYYDMASAWFNRHPEIYFPDNWKNPDFRKRLHGDGNAYASLPDGIPEGMSFGEFFAGQWRHVSEYLGLDAILLRDGFLGPCIYEINGPFGPKGTHDPALVEEWSRELIAFYRATKQGNPNCLVMGYSSARSAVAEFRTGCFDLEALIASDALDIWIDQSWAGAWQDWWCQELRGWTSQLANILVHHAMVVGGNASRKEPCRHYNLIETFDAWEPWDTLRQFPEKLQWGIWAFTHAAVATGEGFSRTAGSYISWAHDWERCLLGEKDVEFLRSNLNAAVSSAQQLEEIYGPAIGYNPAHMRAMQDANPAANATDMIDDHAAILMKWGFPCLSAVRMDVLPLRSHGYLLQVPQNLSEDQLTQLRREDTSYIAAGHAGLMDESLLRDVGVTKGDAIPLGKHRLVPPELVPDEVPVVSAINMGISQGLELTGATAVVRTKETVLVAQSPDGAKFIWQPQYPYNPGSSFLKQSTFGSLVPFVAVARAYSNALKASGRSSVADIPFNLPAAVHYWKSGGHIFVLVGNLESGTVGDSRHPREVTLVFQKIEMGVADGRRRSLININTAAAVEPQSESETEVTFRIPIAPMGSGVYRLEPVSNQD